MAEIPEEIKGKWNWGAFLLSGIWGIGNNAWIALTLALIASPFLFFFPLVSMGAFLFLGWKGNEWAWRSKQWDSVEHFQKVQKKWKKWGFTMIGVLGVLFLFLMVIIIIIGAFA
ncbi:MAG: ribonuclease G [Anaerolineaceae bacterium]|nr:ribonuclease G [Anaerolineaceae bacterium]